MSDDRDVHGVFVEAMSSLASGVAVITARKPDGQPCGLAATSVTSYSAHPPSVLASVSHASRCHDALAGCEHFGVHILRADESDLARVFAGKGDDKFAGLDWTWDDDVPELRGTLGVPALPARSELRPVRPHDPGRRYRARPPGGGRAAALRPPADGLAAAARNGVNGQSLSAPAPENRIGLAKLPPSVGIGTLANVVIPA